VSAATLPVSVAKVTQRATPWEGPLWALPLSRSTDGKDTRRCEPIARGEREPRERGYEALVCDEMTKHGVSSTRTFRTLDAISMATREPTGVLCLRSRVAPRCYRRKNWIPFLPMQCPGNVQHIAFQCTTRLSSATWQDPARCEGVLLNALVLPWFVNEVEVSVVGAIATRSYHGTRRRGGRTNAWIGWRREPGCGLASSSLRFDHIEPVNAAGAGP
jgi:hypothetical protein